MAKASRSASRRVNRPRLTPGQAPKRIELTDDEKHELEAKAKAWDSKSQTRAREQMIALKATVVLAAAKGGPNVQIAKELGISRASIVRWRNRFAAEGMHGLRERRGPSPRTKRTASSDEIIGAMRALTATPPPPPAKRWNAELLADQLQIPIKSVRQIWAEHDFKPPKRTATTDEMVKVLQALVTTPPPPPARRWSSELLGEKLGISTKSVKKIWREHNLQPSKRPATNDETVKRMRELIAMPPPPPATLWSAKLVAAELAISTKSVRKIWREHGFKPPRTHAGRSCGDE